jgi:phage recombination protein Bet
VERNIDMNTLQHPECKNNDALLSGIIEDIRKLNERFDKMAIAFKDKSVPKKPGTSFDDKQLELIKSVAAVGATDNELKNLLYLAEQYDLDPLKKEIIFIKGRNALTTRDGLLKIANRDPQFDGIGGDVVYEGDTLAKRDNESIHITYGTEHLVFNKEKIKGAFANVYRKDRSKCTTVFVSFKDYFKKSTTNTPSIWEQFPNAMILKVAESMALKRAFSLSGLTSQEEMGE